MRYATQPWEASVNGLPPGLEFVYDDGIPGVRTKHLYTEPSVNIYPLANAGSMVALGSAAIPFPPAQTTFDFSPYQRFVEEWKDVLDEVFQLYSCDTAISERAFLHSLSWLFLIHTVAAGLAKPSIVAGGEGGLHIEWEDGGKFVSVFIRGDHGNPDTVYFEQGDGFSSSALTPAAFADAAGTLG